MKALALRPVLLLALLVLAPPSPAQSRTELGEIEEQIGAARFDEADAALRAALASGKLDRRSLARAHLHAGVIASARRDEAAARASFRRALTLEPDATLPASAGPHVSAAYEHAKRELGELGSGLGVAASGTQPRPGTPARIDVRVAGDAERLARRLRIAAASFRDERPVPPLAHAIEVPAPSQGCADVSAELLDRQSNRLWSAPSIARVCAAPPGRAPRSEPRAQVESRPVGAPVWIGLALTGAGALATSVLGIAALDQRADYHAANSDSSRSRSERQVLYDEAQAAERRATVAAVVTGAFAAGTITLYLLRPTRSEAEISLRLAPGAVGATLGAGF
jgi:hypothetical protein